MVSTYSFTEMNFFHSEALFDQIEFGDLHAKTTPAPKLAANLYKMR